MAADARSASPVPPGGASSEASPAEGRKMLGKYELKRKIGAGGMGAVYLAVDTQLKRTVALKILPRDKGNNPLLVRRFHAEAQAAAQLRHDNIVTVFEAGEADGYLYMALEYVAGTDVQALVGREGPLGVARSLEIVKQAARALRHAYERGIVHRDIKPSNLLVSEDGIVKLVDMGLARSVDETMESGITRAGTTVGTVDYMAPEQGRDSKSADIRSDIYSLGCTWFQMLTGTPPFPGGSLTNKLFAHTSKPRPDPRTITPEVPAVIVQVLHRMMARSPRNRYNTPEELLDDLERIDLESLTGEMLPPAALEKLLASGDEFDDSNAAVAARVAERFAETRPAPTRSGAGKSRRLPPRLRSPRFGSRRAMWRRLRASPSWRVAGIAAAVVLTAVISWWALARNGRAVEAPPEGNRVAPIRAPEGDTNDAGAPVASPEPRPRGGIGGSAGDPTSPDAPRPGGDIEPGSTRGGSSATALDIGRAGEEPDLPAWIAGMLTPEQARAAPARGELPVFQVGRAANGPPGRYATLEEALDALPAAGAILRLAGDGVHALPSRRVVDRGHLVLTAADASSPPTIALLADRARRSDAIVSLRNTSLTLAGVHVMFDTRQVPPGGETALFSLNGGELAVRNCSVTATEDQAGEFAAFRLRGAAPSRALLDRSMIRGDRLTVLDIAQPAFEAIVWNCLAVADDAPLVSIDDAPGERESAAETNRAVANPAGTPAGRRLAILSSTLSSTRAGVRLATGANAEPPPTEVVVVNSLVCGRRGAEPGVMALLADWPLIDPVDNSVGARPKNLAWTTRGSLVAGWSELARWGGAEAEAASGESTWRRLWREPVEAGQFRQANWPRERIDDCDDVEPAAFDRETFPGAPGRATDGSSPGCDVALLDVPRVESRRHAAALARRPQPPAGFVDRDAPALVIPVDLNRQDLGALLAARSWPSGTVVVATGRGNCSSSPIRVRGKALRIELKSPAGEPLALIAKPLDRRHLDETAGVFDAFFSVKDGSLEIVGGALRLPSSSSAGSMPNWMVRAEDSDLLLEDCRLEGPILDRTRRDGLIRWTRATERRAAALDPPRGAYERHAVIDGCFLIDGGRMIQADIRERALTIRDSTLVGFDELLALDVRGSHRIGAAVRIERSTLAAGRSFFHVSTSLLSRLADEPLTFFVADSVFLPAGDADGLLDPVVLNCPETALQERQLAWWGTRNGYGVTRYRRVGGAPGDGPQDFDAVWAATWGGGQVAAPLHEAGDVRLRATLEALRRSQIGREAFRLAPGSPATAWRADGGSLGDSKTAPRSP
ncbi:MAG: serine/threonine-protein kinase [Planctomycetaceae bacterium]